MKDSVGYTLVGFGDDDPFEYQAQLSSKFLFALSSGLKLITLYEHLTHIGSNIIVKFVFSL